MASWPTGQTPAIWVSMAEAACALDLSAASRLSNLGHVLPQARAGAALLPSPTQSSLLPWTGKAQ